MTGPRDGDLRRRLRKRLVKAVRQSRLLPATFPDRLGQDDELDGTSLDATVVVYFPDTREALYQLRPWYAPLRELHARHPVVLIFQDSRTAAVVRGELDLPVLTIARYGTLDGLLGRSHVKLALYVNHTPQNFSCLRFTSLAHVYLTHGDSDKGVSVSNQSKAYDFCFVAGQAAVDRMASGLMFTDARQWCRVIGRPPLDMQPVVTTGSGNPGRPTVLYAPTWEGAQPSLAYGSLASLGVPLVRTHLDSNRVTLQYRPHPLAGVTDGAYGTADARIRELIDQARRRDPMSAHHVEVSGPLGESFAGADVLICDVSAVAMDWLPTTKPLIVTVPASEEVVTAKTRLLDVVPRLDLDRVQTIAETVLGLVDDDACREQRLALIDYYVGDTTPGKATQRFLTACSEVIEERDRQWAMIAAHGTAGR
jgi:hypothetical protein